MAMWCTECDRRGRRVIVGAGDYHCRVCRAALRRVELLNPREQIITAAGMLWLLRDAGGTLRVTIRNAGSAEAHVAEVRATGIAGASAVLADGKRSIGPGDARGLSISVPPIHGAVHELTVEVTGDFAPVTAQFIVAPAPKTLKIQRNLTDAPTSRMRAVTSEYQAALAAPADQKSPADQIKCVACQWLVNDPVALFSWPTVGKAQFKIFLDAEPRVAAAAARAWSVQAREVSGPSVVASVIATGPWGCEIELTADPHDQPATGVVTAQLSDGQAGTLIVPFCIEPDPTAWQLGDAQALTATPLPAKIWSGLRVTYSPVGGPSDDPSLAIARYRLEVTAQSPGLVLSVPTAEPVDGSKPDRTFRLRVRPNQSDQPAVFQAQLMRIVGDRPEEPCSDKRTFRVPVYDPKADQDSHTYEHVVIDFGTTNTCVAIVSDRMSAQCVKLSTLSEGQEQPDMIPTLLWINEAGDVNWPECLIGDAARAKISDRNVLREFKPEIGLPDRNRKLFRPDLVEARTVQIRDLVLLFLRELVLELRRERLGQKPINELHVTFPTAFTTMQREELKSVLDQLRDCGIVGDTSVQLDEANAGIIRELYRMFEDLRKARDSAIKAGKPRPADPFTAGEGFWAMIMDFGGGTIDVALVRGQRPGVPGSEPAADDDPLTGTYELRPMGVTGVPDFAGAKITQTLANLLAQKLDQYLNQNGYSDPAVNGTFYVPETVPLALRKFKEIERRAVENRAWVTELAEYLKRGNYTDPKSSSQPSDQVLRAERLVTFAKTKFRASLRLVKRTDAGISFIEIADCVDRWLAAMEIPDAGKSGGSSLPGAGKFNLNPAAHLVTRGELEKEIRIALEEAFDRAWRLWRAVKAGSFNSESTECGPPDFLFLSGNTARLPLVRRLAQERFGIEPSFNDNLAKRAVALGAAEWVAVRGEAQFVGDSSLLLKPISPTDFLLVPVAFPVRYGYRPIFMPGIRVGDPAAAQAVSEWRLDNSHIEVHRLIDYRLTYIDGSPDEQSHQAKVELLAKLGMQLNQVERKRGIRVPPHPGATSCKVKFELSANPHTRQHELLVSWPDRPTIPPTVVPI